MPGRIDLSPLFAQSAPGPVERTTTHLSNVLDAMMARKQAEQLQRDQLAQQRELAGVVDARETWRISEDSRLRDQAAAASAEQNRIKNEHDAAQLRATRGQGFSDKRDKLAMQGPRPFGAGIGALSAEHGIQGRPVQAPVRQGFGATEDPNADEISVVDSIMESNDQQRLAEESARGRYEFDYGGGRVETYDPRPFSPEAREAEIDRAFAGLPNTDPRVITARAMAKAGARSGTIKPGEEYAQTFAPALAAIESEKRAKLNANRPRPISPGQQADDTRADVNAFGANHQRWEHSKGVAGLNTAYDKFSEMRATMDDYRAKKDIIGLRSALYQTARYITGPGVLTPQEYENTVSSTAGVVASALSKLQKGADGDISSDESAALEKFIVNADSAIRRRAAKAVQNFDIKFGPSSYWARQVPEEVAAEREALMQRFGLADEDVRPRGAGKQGAAPVNAKALEDEADAALAAPKGGR